MEVSVRPRILPRQTVVTEDGVQLCTDVYLPPGPGPDPVVLVRTPYGRNMPFLLRMAMRLNQAGLAVVLQDSRGRYQSEGNYDWRLEERDGYDTLRWLAGQSWTNGRVGLVGLSISAHPNFKLAAGKVPEGIEIAAMVTAMGAVDYHSMFYRDGALVLHWALPWCTMMGSGAAGRDRWARRPWAELFAEPRLAEIPEDGFDLRFWRIVVSNPETGGFWDELDAVPVLPRIAVPTLHLSGWYDFMLHHALRSYQGIGSNPEGKRQKLVIGPWDHENLFASFTRPSAEPGLPNLLEAVTAWLARWLVADAVAPGTDEEPDVLLYVVGSDQWLGADRYPLAGAETLDLYLQSEGRANTAWGDGKLVAKAPSEIVQDSFEADPAAAVPTRGGALWPFAAVGLKPGRASQAEIEEREDVLVYTGDPLAEEFTVVGPIRVELWVASSARDADFTAKLVDVDLHGTPRIVQDGILRCRFRDSGRTAALLDPNRPVAITIDLQASGYQFGRGHRLRLEIAGSNFPKFDRNLNTAAAPGASGRGVVARQVVFHGGMMPSRLRLERLAPGTLKHLVFEPPETWGRSESTP